MLYAIKIGNSTVEFGRFLNPERKELEYLGKFALGNFTFDRIAEALPRSEKPDCILCSVVRDLTQKFIYRFRDSFRQILNITHEVKSGLSLKVLNPQKFGSDRLACAVAAHGLYGGDSAVVDGGTATTITVVTSKGEILGGAILPGIETMNICLQEKTDTLPLVELSESPIQALGRDTEEAIRSGIVLGTVYAVEGIVNQISRELNLNLELVLTGGNGGLISRYLSTKFILNPHLVFEGMRLIYLKNKTEKEGLNEVSENSSAN